jgi:lipopolysaccharide biosynthesis protein
MKINAIAIYLPQYHPIPENDEWWGKGFTEWTNVVKAKPLFKGHYQPHLPADLGFYDLRLEESRLAQEELARSYNIHGFCYYHYWFNGRRILEKPLEAKLNNPKETLPYMICWANENWSRRWDGSENEILLSQEYSIRDAENHAKELLRYITDERYIKYENRPLFAIYKPFLIPNCGEYLSTLKQTIFNLSGINLHIAAFDTGSKDLLELEQLFDSIIEFQPHSPYLKNYISQKIQEDKTIKTLKLIQRFSRYKIPVSTLLKKRYLKLEMRIDYSKYVDFIFKNYRPNSDKIHFPGITPMWDNTARRGINSFLFLNNSPEKYAEWLRFILEKNKLNKQEFLFVNAWNEWAEGNHLEPCQKYGLSYLEVTKYELDKINVEEIEK